ncbi:MAG: hypothetical protein ACRC6I_14675, partial [Paracoccaceae bacterium]
SVVDGTFEVRELSPAQYTSDTFDAYFERRLSDQEPGPGYVYEFHVGNLAAMTTAEGDGSPSIFCVESADGGRVFFDQRLGRERLDYYYHKARPSPDGARVAVIRDAVSASADPPVQLMVYEVATALLLFAAPVPEGPLQRQIVWLPDDRIAVLQTVSTGTTEGFVFNLPGGD